MGSAEGGAGDLTRKQRREQARAQRRALEEAAAANLARRKRLAQLGGVMAVVAVGIVVILVATSGGSGSTSPHTPAQKTATVAEVTKLIGGIPQSGNTLGSPTAPVTLKYFGDLECPICADFTVEALPAIIQKYVRMGQLRIEYHSMPTATANAEKDGAEPAGVFDTQQLAAYAAGRQGKAWNFIETFYREQGAEDSGYVTENFIDEIAKQVPGLNLAQWQSDRGAAALTDELEADKRAANDEGFTGTPSFLIGRSGGRTSRLEYTSSPGDPAFLEEAVEKLLKS